MREGKGREGKGREGKGREGEGVEGRKRKELSDRNSEMYTCVCMIHQTDDVIVTHIHAQ